MTRTIEDLRDLEDGARVRLIPNAMNPLHKKPIFAVYSGGYFYCDGSDPLNGPDYYFRDVFSYNEIEIKEMTND